MKIFRLILILALGLQIGFGEGESGNSGSGQNVSGVSQEDSNGNEKDLFSEESYNSGSCVWRCRKINSKYDNAYQSQIIGFDSRTGTTQCIVKNKSTGKSIERRADLQVKGCSLGENEKYKETAQEYIDIRQNNKGSIGSKIQYDYPNRDNYYTMSAFLAGLVTLDPNIVNRYSASQTGEIAPANKQLYGITSIYSGNSQFKERSLWNLSSQISDLKNAWSGNVATATLNSLPLSTETTTALDGFNKHNMAYFSDLFAANSIIYKHLQVFIFVLIGGFFVTQIGASKLQAYLENRGESEGKQPYLHKFYIPLLMIGIFFMPIPEGTTIQVGNQSYQAHSTVMQNMIRYFAQYSTTIADMAHSVGAKVYMDKIYKRIGAYPTETLGAMALEYDTERYYLEVAQNIFMPMCNYQYPNLSAQSSGIFRQGSEVFVKNDDGSIYTMNDVNQMSNTNKNISAAACITIRENINQSLQKQKRMETMKTSFKNFESKGKAIIDEIDDYFVIRNRQLGWIDSVITPTASIAVETIMLKQLLDDLGDAEEKMEKSLKANKKNIQTIIKDGDVDKVKELSDDEIENSLFGAIGGKLVYMMMPGAMAIKDFILDNFNKIQVIITAKWVTASVMTSGLGFLLSPLFIVGQLAMGVFKTGMAYYATTVLIEWTFDMIPYLAISTACLIAFVSYLVSLCKYFYISPFVTAWAMATKKVDKIIDFLLAGIAIFFKPILIVLFIYLALFLNTLINEMFLFVSMEQFAGIKTHWHNFHTNFVIGAIGGLLKIFGALATSYISWKLIVDGPSWALGMVGLDGKQDDMIAQGLENKLASRAFVA